MPPLPRWSSDLVPVAALIGASFLLPVGGVAFTIAGGVAASLATPLTKSGSDWCIRRLIGGQDLLNHDLRAALLRAFDQSMHHLEKLWETSYQRDARRNQVVGESSPASIKALFKDLRQDAETILTDSRLKSVVGSAEALQLLDRQDFGTQATFNAYLHPYLNGHSQQFVTFLRRNFAPELACRFGEELKADTKAWRAFQRLVNDSLLDAAREMRDKQDAANTVLSQVETQLKSLADRLSGLPETERDATGEAGLDSKIAEARDQVIAAMAVQFGVAQDQTRAWFEETWALITGDLREAEERIVTRVLAGVRQELKGQFDAVPEIRSPIFEVPYQWSRYFVGRDTLLDRIHAGFASKTGPVALVQTIQGLGGVGKTQAAVHFAYKFGIDYEGIWWLQAESSETLAANYAALARRLGLLVAESYSQAETYSQDDLIAAVRTHLERTEETGKRWLLIFDNAVPFHDATETKGALDRYLPRRGRCDVLITSRDKAWAQIASEQDVDVLDEDDAVQFLTMRTGENDQEAARNLAEELGYLPLALEQAGAYIWASRGQETLAGYLERFRFDPLNRLALDRAKIGDYGDVVATTWFISFDEIERRLPVAGDLLRLCAFLAPERIPLQELVTHAQVLPERLAATLRDPDGAVEAVALLLRFSLADSAEARTINVHRLVQLVVREWLSDDEQRLWAGGALDLANEIFVFEEHDPTSWIVCEHLIGQAQAATASAEHFEIQSSQRGDLLNRIGEYLSLRASLDPARALLEQALSVQEALYGPEHSEVSRTLDGLGRVLGKQGKLAEARDLHERALTVSEMLNGFEHPDVARSLNNLASVLQAQGKYAEAKPLLERALLIRETVYGPEHPDVARSLNNLAGVLHDQGQYAEARPLFEQAFSIAENTYGPDHPDVATSLNNLAGVLQRQGQYAEARPLFERALSIAESIYGPEHPEVATSLSNVAGLLHDQGRHAEAKPLLERALSIDENAYGPEHPEVAKDLNKLAGLLRDQGRHVEAKPLFERALSIAESSYGPEHPDVAKSLSNLGNLFQDQGRHVEAKPLFERALTINENTYGSDHPDVATSLNNLATLLQARGRHAEAEPLFERAIDILETTLGPEHPNLAKALANFGVTLKRQGKFADARKVLRRALTIFEFSGYKWEARATQTELAPIDRVEGRRSKRR